jgi:peptidoglycan/xylan/chitin deacetylase (PgdA/CDA1 family)
MRIYWVNRKRLWTISAALFSIIFTLLVLVSYYRWSGIEANANKEAIYQGNTGKKVVAICVNVDWGEEYIPAMLEEFKKAQAQVTFFVTGSWAEKNPELLKQMSEAGHSIQNHAYKHVHFSSLSDAEAQAQIKKAEAVIEKIIGKKTRFFAPPLWRTK